jgi:hypothetical protein
MGKFHNKEIEFGEKESLFDSVASLLGPTRINYYLVPFKATSETKAMSIDSFDLRVFKTQKPMDVFSVNTIS